MRNMWVLIGCGDTGVYTYPPCSFCLALHSFSHEWEDGFGSTVILKNRGCWWEGLGYGDV